MANRYDRTLPFYPICAKAIYWGNSSKRTKSIALSSQEARLAQ
ncbi:hypothetical protein [Legionella sp. W05-934-2]